MLNQSAMRYYKRIGYHEFEGVANDLDERERIVADLGDHKCLIMKHHGLLTAGVNVGEAFNLMYYLEKSCETQMQVLASNQPYSLPSEESCEKSARIFWGNGRVHDRDWPALGDARRQDRPVVPELRLSDFIFQNEDALVFVMAGLVPAIHVFDAGAKERRGCPARGRA